VFVVVVVRGYVKYNVGVSTPTVVEAMLAAWENEAIPAILAIS
jgi:hypothetical protein